MFWIICNPFIVTFIFKSCWFLGILIVLIFRFFTFGKLIFICCFYFFAISICMNCNCWSQQCVVWRNCGTVFRYFLYYFFIFGSVLCSLFGPLDFFRIWDFKQIRSHFVCGSFNSRFWQKILQKFLLAAWSIIDSCLSVSQSSKFYSMLNLSIWYLSCWGDMLRQF